MVKSFSSLSCFIYYKILLFFVTYKDFWLSETLVVSKCMVVNTEMESAASLLISFSAVDPVMKRFGTC